MSLFETMDDAKERPDEDVEEVEMSGRISESSSAVAPSTSAGGNGKSCVGGALGGGPPMRVEDCFRRRAEVGGEKVGDMRRDGDGTSDDVETEEDDGSLGRNGGCLIPVSVIPLARIGGRGRGLGGGWLSRCGSDGVTGDEEVGHLAE